MCMSVDEEAIKKAIGRVNASLACWGCTNYSKYHADRLNTYRNCPNKVEPDVADLAKRLIQEYFQQNSMMGGGRGDRNNQVKWGRTSSMAVKSMCA